MPSTPLSPEKSAEVKALAQAIHAATEVEIDELAGVLLTIQDRDLWRQRGSPPHPGPQDRRQGAGAALSAKKNGYEGSSVSCPHCGRAAEFHSHRPHTPTSLVGPISYQRAYYLCRCCSKGLFPFDQQAGLTARNLTPGLERVVTLAGTVADSFEKGADLVHEMAGIRLGESTIERTTEDAGQRLAADVQAGRTFGPKVVWPWHKDYRGRTCAYIEMDATGVRQQGEGATAAEGRMAYVGLVANLAPEWPWPDETREPLKTRYLSGLYPLVEFGPLLRKPAGQVGLDQADLWLGLTDGGNGLEDRLEENFPRVEVVILDFFHPAERLTGLARLLYPKDEAAAEEQARQWRGLLKDEGGALLAAVLREYPWPRRAGLAEAVANVVEYLEKQAHRMEYPEYLAQGWNIGSGAVESACKTVVGQRLKLAGMRWGEDGADALCHLRALYRSEKGQWDAFWSRQYSHN